MLNGAYHSSRCRAKAFISPCTGKYILWPLDQRLWSRPSRPANPSSRSRPIRRAMPSLIDNEPAAHLLHPARIGLSRRLAYGYTAGAQDGSHPRAHCQCPDIGKIVPAARLVVYRGHGSLRANIMQAVLGLVLISGTTKELRAEENIAAPCHGLRVVSLE